MPVFSSFAELAAYLMVYIARVDGQVHYLEEETLHERMRQFTPAPGQAVVQANETCDAFPTVKVEEVMNANEQLISDATYDERLDLIQSLYSIINSDGRVEEEEMNTLRAVRAGLEQSEAPAPSL